MCFLSGAKRNRVHMAKSLREGCNVLLLDVDTVRNRGKLRSAWVANFWLGLFDLLAIAHGLIAFCLPSRTFLLCAQMYSHNVNIDTHKEKDLKYNLAYRLCAIYNLWVGLLDLLTLVLVSAASCLLVVCIHELVRLFGSWAKDYRRDKYGKLRLAVCTLSSASWTCSAW